MTAPAPSTDTGVQLSEAGPGALCLRMAAPRANALEPGLLDAMRRAMDQVERADPDNLMIFGGRNFCSGGDVARFLKASRAGEARAYASRVVPALQEIVLRLIALPGTVTVAARGAVTGGGAGLLFAADCAILAPDAFVQPYYARMGFAPDGGWTATLPLRIGAGRALSWLTSDARHDAQALLGMGLCTTVDPDPEGRALAMAQELSGATRRDAKALLFGPTVRVGIASGLSAETEAFLTRIEQETTQDRMAAYLGA